MIDRRSFLKATASATLAALAPQRLLAAVAANTPALPDLSSWENVRAQFALDPGRLHFSTFYFASHPRPVREAIDAFRRALDAEPYLEVEHLMFENTPENIQRKLRADMCGYLGARPEEIAINTSTTSGLALVYAGLPLGPGDEVLTSVHDHYSHHESIRFATQRAHASMRRFALYEAAPRASVAGMTASLRAALRPETRVVGLTWVHSCTGVRTPIRELAQVIAEANRARSEATRILLVVDGVHGLGVIDESVADLGCDFLCAGTHKWMLAPRGTGIVWAKAENWARLTPTIPTFASEEAFLAWRDGDTKPRPITAFDMSPGGFHAFEHQWGMTAAFRFHEAIGRARVAARIRELNDRCKAGLAAIPRVKVVTPTDPGVSAGIICFEIEGLSAETVAEKLMARRIVSGPSPYTPSYPRLAPSIVNTPAEVDEAVRAVRAIAAA